MTIDADDVSDNNCVQDELEHVPSLMDEGDVSNEDDIDDDCSSDVSSSAVTTTNTTTLTATIDQMTANHRTSAMKHPLNKTCWRGT